MGQMEKMEKMPHRGAIQVRPYSAERRARSCCQASVERFQALVAWPMGEAPWKYVVSRWNPAPRKFR
jgi:hypothetical protein